MVKEWNNRYSIYFIHWFELNRLIKKIPLDEDPVVVNGNEVLNSKIETSITDKFNKENIMRISEDQCISRLVNHRLFGNSKVVEKEIEPIPNVYLKYYD